jgi:hypothetical protein
MLQERSAGHQLYIVGIDGVDGAGKTRLTKYLSEALHSDCTHIDDLVERDRRRYVDFVDVVRLQEFLERHRAFGPSLRSVGTFGRVPGSRRIESEGFFGASGTIPAENVWAHD